MARIELVDTAAHRDLRIATQAGAALGDARHFVPIVVREFAEVAAHYPILLAKDADTGAFFAGAVLGFGEGENLFLGPRGQSSYRPLGLRREPFFIQGDSLAIDVDHPRVGATNGETLFEEDGAPSGYLRSIQQALTQLKHGSDETRGFLQRMLQLELVEPIDISLNFDDGSRVRLDGVYTISADALHEIDDAEVVSLFRVGYLELAHLVIASLRQVPVLARLRNDRLVDGV